ncbi:dehydration-responsive element-binding protein 1B-like [Lotus japonicus]|uniref:dehydration-responsive element-binding protein 1B-like n=1 Tax=Lotus japonicus TaxID=34305 RepID=UPI00258C21E4|nr:dehydration-responsive element-binding protein 1B-like [Lotus japonicus]
MTTYMPKIQKRKAGRKKFHETRHPTYKGVKQRNGKWVCELRQPNNKKARVWLGTFSHPDMAAVAYDVAALAFKGDAASLNFPHAATSFPRLNSRTCSVRAIQFAAMEAAEKHFSCRDDVMDEGEMIERSDKRGGSDELCLEVAGLGGNDSGRLYWDEEEVFNLPGLINSMAEGLIITPPALERGFSWAGGETTVDLTLWEN